ncbi:AAEL007890-PA [Aedes aegypti]|uniref:AAEL007890-PA n=1 Tax=Aedes aegypti TaxID=7159 RepID=Q170K9_AEDAE|nr:AAEL007890-PA [Aedes aegypti]
MCNKSSLRIVVVALSAFFVMNCTQNYALGGISFRIDLETSKGLPTVFYLSGPIGKGSVSFVQGEFQFTVLPKHTQVYEGESVVFQCRAFFDDEIDFSWTLNGNPIRLDRRVYLNGSNLHINGVSQRSDGGDYVCLATARSSGARVATPPAKLDIIP